MEKIPNIRFFYRRRCGSQSVVLYCSVADPRFPLGIMSQRGRYKTSDINDELINFQNWLSRSICATEHRQPNQNSKDPEEKNGENGLTMCVAANPQLLLFVWILLWKPAVVSVNGAWPLVKEKNSPRNQASVRPASRLANLDVLMVLHLRFLHRWRSRDDALKKKTYQRTPSRKVYLL